VRQVIQIMEADGRLLRSADGQALYTRRLRPQRDVDLRGAATVFQIREAGTGKRIGDIDAGRAFVETHAGAVYLHNGVTYQVERLDVKARLVHASRCTGDRFTRATVDKDTKILRVEADKTVGGSRIVLGRLKVTERVAGYERWKLRPRRRIGVFPLDLPPREIETEGFWIAVPRWMETRAARRHLDLLGGLHAAEHAAIGILPVEVLADRQDLGGFSTLHQPQLGCPAIFVYDGIAGGAGLSRQAFVKAEAVFRRTRQAIADCPCESGCPGCVQSPRCGSGNRPLDKKAALFVLDGFLERLPRSEASAAKPVATPAVLPDSVTQHRKTLSIVKPAAAFGVLDLETRRSAEEVGGWRHAARMEVSCAVCYDSRSDRFLEFFEEDIPELIETLSKFEQVVGFNIRRFDYKVLSAYSRIDFGRLPTVDLMDAVMARLGFRLSLGHLAETTLGVAKSADGLAVLRWWQQGRADKVLAYCRKDVEITRDLYLFGNRNGHVLFRDKGGRVMRIPVDW
jgi:DEAD/DEAH box helicase domain-containing protein